MESNKALPWLIVVLLACTVLILAMSAFLQQAANAPDGFACTMEAKLCPDGSYVGREGPNCEFAACPTPAPAPVGNGCRVSGCGGEICQDASEEPAVSICIYKNEFACYKTAKCERQTDGKCGWTQTSELKTCLQNPPKQP